MVSDNLNPMHLVYVRKAAYGVQDFKSNEKGINEESGAQKETPDTVKLLKMIMEQLAERD